jgi:hypothetical protein
MCFTSTSFTCKAMALPDVYTISKIIQQLHDKAPTCHSRNAQWEQKCPNLLLTSQDQNSQCKCYTNQ